MYVHYIASKNAFSIDQVVSVKLITLNFLCYYVFIFCKIVESIGNLKYCIYFWLKRKCKRYLHINHESFLFQN